MPVFASGSGLTPAQEAAGLAAGKDNSKQYHLTWVYDTVEVVSASSTTTANFFTSIDGKTWTQSNMRSASILPGVRALTVATILITHFDATNGNVLATDLAELGWGYFALFLRDRPQPDYVQTRLLCGGPGIVVGGSTTRGTFGNGTIANALSFFDPFLTTIQGNEPFRGEMRWDTGITLTNTIEVTVALYGRGTREN